MDKPINGLIKNGLKTVVWSDLIEELNLSGLAKMLANNCALLGRKENTISFNR